MQGERDRIFHQAEAKLKAQNTGLLTSTLQACFRLKGHKYTRCGGMIPRF
jgi:hypothetical protein